MEINRFLANAWKGEQSLTKQLLAIFVTWAMMIFLGSFIMQIPYFWLSVTNPSVATAYALNPFDSRSHGIDSMIVAALALLGLAVGLVPIWFTEKQFLKKQFHWVVTGFERIRFKRILAGMVVFIALMCIYQSVTYLLDPASLKFVVQWDRFLTFLPIALVLVPLQSAFEEIAIRGQLLQALIRLAPSKPYLPLFLTSLIFALLHFMNNEVQAYGASLMLAHYFTFGLILGAFALMDEGLELSIGIHAGNNLFSILLVSYPESSMQTPTLMEQQTMAATTDYFVMILMVVVMFFIFFGRRIHAWKAIFQNMSPSLSKA